MEVYFNFLKISFIYLKNKYFGMNNRAQGTIEYLVIIAVVVVLSLVVVGLLITQVENSSNVTSTASDISTKVGVGGLSLGSSVMGEMGMGC